MAWRIHDSVLRGEIDNRKPGLVRGRIWLHGQDVPVHLEIEGNACADLAGCTLRFENPGPTTPLDSDALLDPRQSGRVGDLSASRKVRVFDVPILEACDHLRRGGKAPEHLANCLHLEWFSTTNGRIVIESTGYRLTLSAPDWRLTAGDELQRQATVQLGWTCYLETLTNAVAREQARLPQHKDPEHWDEFDYEQFLREWDAQTHKIMALYDRHEGNPDADAIVAREMGWDPTDPGTRRKIAGRLGPRPLGTGSMDGAHPDPRSEGVDWVRDDYGMAVHPLYRTCHRASREASEALEKLDKSLHNDPDIAGFNCEFHRTKARLADSLNGLAYGRQRREAAFIVASLKRALGHVQGAQAALERIRIRALLPEESRRSARDQLAALHEGMLALVVEFRGVADGSR